MSRIARKLKALKARREQNIEKARRAFVNGDSNFDQLQIFGEWLNKRIKKLEEKQ